MKSSQVKNGIIAIILSIYCMNGISQVTPKPPTIKYVSVDPVTNDITIAWYKSPEIKIDSLFISHIVQKSPSIQGQPIYYTKLNTDSSYTVNVLKIASIGTSTVKNALSFAIDSKLSGVSSTNMRFYQTTIYATAVFNKCPSRCDISWTKYHGTKSDGTPIVVNSYTIYKAEVGGNRVVGTVTGADSTFSHYFTQGSGQFDYYIEAEITDVNGHPQKSTSNLASTNVILQKYPTFIYGNYSQVNTDNSLKLSFSVDLNSDITHYKLYKSQQHDGPYVELPYCDVASAAKRELILYDTTKGVALNRCFYKLCAINSCGDTILSSNILSNIVVTAEKGDNSNLLSWIGFYEWPKGIKRYELYRSIDKDQPFLLLTESDVSQNNYSYTDVMNILSGKGNNQCYFVEAYPNEEQPYVQNKSVSNTACITQEDRIFIPDAFNPVSKVAANRKFRPVVAFVNTSTYQFTVYNRLSEAIFTTNDPTASWDGTFKNSMVPEGTYIYDVKYKNSEDKTIEKRGTFFVIFNEK